MEPPFVRSIRLIPKPSLNESQLPFKMIEIRPDQMQIFQDQVRSTFVKRARRYLRDKRGEWVGQTNDEALEALIRSQVIAAESFGIATEAGVIRFIEAGLILGVDFYSSGQYPDAERILHRAGVDQDTKLKQLEELAGSAAARAHAIARK